MNRFDLDPQEAYEDATRLDEEATRERTSHAGGSPPVASSKTRKPETAVKKDAQASQESETYDIRVRLQLSEDDPLGRALATCLRSMPETARRHYSIPRALRHAIMKNLEAIAKDI